VTALYVTRTLHYDLLNVSLQVQHLGERLAIEYNFEAWSVANSVLLFLTFALFP